MRTASGFPARCRIGEIREHPERHSKAVMQSFYRTPEFCAACHKANLPNPLERLQVHSRFYHLRRMAELEVFRSGIH